MRLVYISGQGAQDMYLLMGNGYNVVMANGNGVRYPTYLLLLYKY
jgi:hypothetical protein